MTKKVRFINQLDSLSAAEKETIISFFNKHSVYESRIDWNNKSLKYCDFDKLIKSANDSRKNIKRMSKENPEVLFKDFNCRIVAKTGDYLIVKPLDWECAVFFNSYNCGGTGAKWCIGNKKNNNHWNNYIAMNFEFYFLFFTRIHPVYGKKMIIEYDLRDDKFKTWDENNKMYWHDFLIPPILFSGLETGKSHIIKIRKNRNCHIFPDNSFYVTTDIEEKFIIVKRNIRKYLLRLNPAEKQKLPEKSNNVESLRKITKSIHDSITNDADYLYKKFIYTFTLPDPISLELGYGLIHLVENEKETMLLERIQEMRSQIADEMGIVIPRIRILDSPLLDICEYQIMINGVNKGTVNMKVKRGKTENASYAEDEDHSLICTNLKNVIKRNITELLDLQMTQGIIDELKNEHPEAVNNLLMLKKNGLTLVRIKKVLHGLLKEQVSLKNMVCIIKSINDNFLISEDTRSLVENIKQNLARQMGT